MIFRQIICKITILLTLLACSEQTRLVNDDSSLWGGFYLNEIYETLDETFLLEVNKDNEIIFALSPKGSEEANFRIMYSVPKSSIDSELVLGIAYQFPVKAIEIIPAGSKIQIISIVQEYTNHFFFGEITYTTAYGKLLNTKSSISSIDLTNLSYRYEVKDDFYLSKPNKRFLKHISHSNSEK